MRKLADIFFKLMGFGDRWPEFFEGENGKLSNRALIVFLSFWPAAWIAVKTESENIFYGFVGAYVLNSIGGKAIDVYGRKKKNAPHDSKS